ncbi:MAG: YHS domain-containing protein [bacterium]|jgi:YHS domain-containing protein|nr:YHS domain-containing protein [bacterium]MDD3806119.1 YHS domain-containing protein [bacterium]MDD4153296.1 YHS domain-containing protein [bacterium]
MMDERDYGTEIKDPVCGLYVNKNDAENMSVYDGITYYFCSLECMNLFFDDPDHYSICEAGRKSGE